MSECHTSYYHGNGVGRVYNASVFAPRAHKIQRAHGYNRISMRIALAQLNPTVGDLAGNVDRMTRASRDAAARGAEAVVFPELSITGYPPRDLVEKPAFLESCERELDRLAHETADLDLSVICGYVGRSEADTGKRALNRAALIERG